MVFRFDRSARPISGALIRRVTMVGAKKNEQPGQRAISRSVSATSKPPDSGITVFAALATCGSPYRPAPWLIADDWIIHSVGRIGSPHPLELGSKLCRDEGGTYV